MMDQTRTILTVDDESLNLKLLEAHLLPQGYRVLKASCGEEALKMAKEGPDLILLDIMMPDMDGFETCQRLKANETTRSIPVIFLSALRSPENKAKGLETGGVDFVSKPFDAQELLARVKTHLALREQEVQLKNYASRLEEMVEERTRQLIHADRLATLGTFSAAIAHEINNPLTCLVGYGQLARLTLRSLKQLIEGQDGTPGKGALDEIDEMNKALNAMEESGRLITKLVSSLKSYGRGNDTQKEKNRLIDIVNDVLILLNHRVKHGVSIEMDVPQDLEIDCNRQKICQVFVNLFNNAMDAMGDGHGKIMIRAKSSDGRTQIEIKDNGPGIPEDIGNQIFEPFFTTKGRDKGTGLGLFIVRCIIEEHQGQILLKPREGEGAAFDIMLPAQESFLDSVSEGRTESS